jgi:hypothetical protein
MRLRGDGLRNLHQQDRIEEMLRTLCEMRMIDDTDPDNDELLDIMRDALIGLASGSYRGQLPDWDPRSETAVKMGHENPISWVREQEARTKEWKRKRRIQCARQK